MEEIEPPWIKHPEYLPGEVFWRQEGQIWFDYVWRPYYNSLSKEEQEKYMQRWNVPEEWKKFYFDEEFQKWLESVDEED